MNRSTFKQAYHAARIGQINPDTLESVAAILALEERKKVDRIGAIFRFALDLSGVIEKREKIEALKARRKARKTAYDSFETECTKVETVYNVDSVSADFNSVYTDR